MTTSEHMQALAREHPGGFCVIPAMFERWAAEIARKDQALRKVIQALSLGKACNVALAALEGEEEPDANATDNQR